MPSATDRPSPIGCGLRVSLKRRVWFARRDAYWASGDARFFAVNDVLQYLGRFAFRPPVPAYRHDAALFLHGRGRIATDRTHPGSPARPDSDRAVLAGIADALDALDDA